MACQFFHDYQLGHYSTKEARTKNKVFVAVNRFPRARKRPRPPATMPLADCNWRENQNGRD